MRFAYLLILILLLPFSNLQAQQTPWYLNGQPISELEGPYVTAVIFATQPILVRSFSLALIQEKDTAEVGIEISRRNLILLNFRLTDAEGTPIIIGNWASVTNGFYR